MIKVKGRRIHMDINELINEDVVISELQNEVLEKIKEFKSLNEKISSITSPIKIEKMNAFQNEFNNFFEVEGFKVTIIGTNIREASKGHLLFKLTNNGLIPDTVFTFEFREKNIYKTIEILPSEQCSELLTWRKNLRDMNVDSIWKDSYLKEIRSILSTDKLNRINQELKQNIEWYKKTLEDTASINYVYRIYGENREFKSFKEFFEYL